MFALALVGFTQFQYSHVATGRVSLSTHVDGVIVGLSVGAASVMLWFDAILQQTGDALAVVVGLAYPLFDVVFVVVLVAGLAPARFKPSLSATTFMAGIVAFAVGDVVYLQQISNDAYLPGTTLEWTWVLGILAFGLAAWAPADRAEPLDTKPGLQTDFLPALAAVIAISVLVPARGAGAPPLAFWMAIAAIAGVVLRLAFTIRDLRSATDSFRLARTDELTGLLNRRGFNERLDRMLSTIDTRHCTVMIIDLNGFKEVNDSLGHHAGDQLLRFVAKRFERVVPAGGLVARLGGDEFGVAISGTPADGADVAGALIAALERPISADGVAIRVGAAIGLAQSSLQGFHRGELLRSADVAMYSAKSRHTGFAWYVAEGDPHTRDRLSLIEDLRTAIELRSFEMHYQPSVEVTTGRIMGMEALLRWNHPVRGRLLPDEFIPLAERVGLIPAITRSVLDLSIGELALLRARGHDLRLSVNISAKDLVDDDLPDHVERALHLHRVPSSSLTLEITETALAIDPQRATRTLDRLRSRGIRISIDDFGVGYSSMSQLLQLPLDELKIDRSFVAQLSTDVRARAILRATVELGVTLGLEVVAEGVETEAALEEVSRRGIEIAQGHLFSPALPFDSFVALIERSPHPFARCPESATMTARLPN